MPRKLVDMEITAVAGVDHAANRRKWLIMKNAGDVEKQQTKHEDGEDFPPAAFAYVPDPEKPSTWKLRLWDSLADKETPAQVGRAVAALGPGFRGQRVELPSEDRAAVINRVRAAWKRVHPDAEDDEVPEILKQVGGAAMSSDGWLRRVVTGIAKHLGIDHVEKMAMTTGEVLEHDQAMSRFWDLRHALSQSLESIIMSEDASDRSEMFLRSISEFADGVKMLRPHLKMQEEMYKADGLVSDLQKSTTPDSAMALLKVFKDPNNTNGEGVEAVNVAEILKGLSVEDRRLLEEEIAKSAKPAVPPEIQAQLTELTKAAAQVADLQKRAEEADKRAQQAEEIAKFERDARISREYLEKGARYPAIGAAQQVADMLRKAFDMSAEFGQQLEATFQKSQGENEANNILLKSIGRVTPTVDEGSAAARVEKMARERVAKGAGATYEQAYDQVLRENPALYTEMNNPRGGN